MVLNYKTTAEIKVPEKLIDQVIGQDSAVNLIRKAAKQRRNVLLVGEPGTGKSMLAKAMADIMPIDKLYDILSYPNPLDSNEPVIQVVDAGEAKKMVQGISLEEKSTQDSFKLISFLIPLGWFILAFIFWELGYISDIIFAATLLVGAFIVVGLALSSQMKLRSEIKTPKILIDNEGKKTAPFVDATGAKAGAMFGDVKHDPLQTGGLGTPAHLRVMPGYIHKANKGVLFIDEMATLGPNSQQDLLTALQEKRTSITGQSELSSGAMVRTKPVPCDFVLVAAGNYEALQNVHPALRSRIRGYGYEIYINKDMDDTPENRDKLVQFVAQEIKMDAKIPSFTKEAVEVIIFEARRRASTKSKLTLKMRELGGLIRASGDLALERGKNIVDANDVLDAKKLSRTLEEQMIEKHIEITKNYEVFETKGKKVGKVNGLAVLNDMQTGTVIPIEAEISPAQSKTEGKIVATGKLGEIAKEAVLNISALIKRISKVDLSNYDIHIQFLQTYSGVEGDSASVSIITAVISAISNMPIDQSIAMTGSLSVKGEVLPIGGATAKVNAAIKAGFAKVILPKANIDDVVLLDEDKNKIKIIPAHDLYDILEVALINGNTKKVLLERLKKELNLGMKK
ncbi:MAG: ATP-dependent protease LonB [Candidatus Diapherotrites archaeon CG08_land_8_20_14_0_20_30_16]|nr:MAG: ATP-dependent protease LonB [Candidatus Diapherotrites archaeon CG08_land_8_20_14_0_20_30_16]